MKLYRVTGESMEPTYSPGAMLLGSGWVSPRPGRVVVLDPRACTPGTQAATGRNHIKRICRIDQYGVWVEGDNAESSIDSRQVGYIGLEHIQAVIVKKIA
jgi:phage repressor protein C with HTH and peptisase S24 domain